MHKLSASFVLGYHGCDEAVAEQLLLNQEFHLSQNDYDWLGEGAPNLYPDSAFMEKNHVQIAVRNLDCIKGVFRVPKKHLDPTI